MSKTLILCEKPSQAADFSKGLDETFTKNNGYYESPSYILCHARGHLIKLVDPEEYDEKFKNWDMATLPIIPTEFKYKAEEDDRSILFKQIANQLKRNDVSKIVIATDAEREGELIARLILKMSNISQTSGKELFRFWTSGALDTAEIKRTMNNLKPLSYYDRLYNAALARQQADWLIGINGTRAATIKAGAGGGKSGVISIGRVQTPTLYILAMRSKAINNFVPQKYYELEAIFTASNGEYKGKLIDGGKIKTFDLKSELDAVIATISGINAKVKSVTKTKKTQSPPKLYSLSGVQKEANAKYGLKATEVLDTLQSLYDKKFTTYPRSGSEVLEEQMVEAAQRTLQSLLHTGIDISNCTIAASNKRVFNNKELTDHHAIIPTCNKPYGLTDNEKIIYDMVCRRFIAAFAPDYIFEATEIITQVGTQLFRTTGNRTVENGWRNILDKAEKEDSLPAVKIDEIVTLELKPAEKETTPPKHYIDGTLLEDMESAHKFVKDETLKKYLKENAGIGTPATQAGIIETLIKRGYAERKGKNIVATASGTKLIEQMENEQVCDPAYTAIWESTLEDIAAGKIDSSNFIQSTIEATKYLVNSIKSKDLTGVSKTETAKSCGKCPLCGALIIEFPKGFSCSNKSDCKFVLWKNKLAFAGKAEITVKDAEGIFKAYEENSAYEVKLKSKAGKPYTAPVALREHPQYGWGIEILKYS